MKKPIPKLPDVDNERKPLDSEFLKMNKTYEDEKRKNDNLLKQVQIEYKMAHDARQPWLEKVYQQVKLYNNQKRAQDKVGVPMVFSIVQTLLASLYDDRLIVEYAPNDPGDVETAENLNALAEYDYVKMRKYQLDLFWIFDTIFTGRGIIDASYFDFKKKIPVPQVVDTFTFLRDPFGSSVHGDLLGKDAIRFGGEPVRTSKAVLQKMYRNAKENKLAEFWDLDNLKYDDELDDLVYKARQERNYATNNSDTTTSMIDLGDNAELTILKWRTHYQGKKCDVWLGNNRQKIIRYKVIEDDYFPWIDRPLYPDSRNWDCVSVPDIVGDKQRMTAVILNLIQESLKFNLYPRYLYNWRSFDSEDDLANYDFKQFIPVKGNPNTAVAPMTNSEVNLGIANYVLNTLDMSAQKATATPEITQGVASKEARTLGELNLISAKVDTRYSLSAKVLGWSESEYWRQHYFLYKKHFNNQIAEKTLRLTGGYGYEFRKLTKDNIIMREDPDVQITSKILNEAKRIKNKQELFQLAQLYLQDPAANRRYILEMFGKLSGFSMKQVHMMLPKTPDQIMAERENKELSENNNIQVKATDDHMIHYMTHISAADTPAKKAHAEAHLLAIAMQKANPEAFPGLQQQQAQEAQFAAGLNGTLNSQSNEDPVPSGDLMRRRDARQQLAASNNA